MENQQESVIKFELDWLEKKFQEMMQTLDDNPPHLAEDRTEIIPTAKGVPIIKVISDKEKQIKAWQSLLKDVMAMLPELKKLREENEASKIELQGGAEMNGMMRRRVNL